MATTEWLLLRVPAQDDAPLDWAAADSTGQLLAVPTDEHDAGLRAMAAGRRIALVVPAGDVSHFQVQLPAGNEARLAQLAPFALEDLVSEDLEQLHFAVGRRDAETGLTTVAVAERARMEQWLARAAALQLRPATLLAESELAPALPGHVTMLLVDDQLLLRRDGAAAVQLPAADPLLALELLLGADADLSAVNLAVYASAAQWPAHEAAIEALRERVGAYTVQLEAGGLLALYARNIVAAQPTNLLQGAYKPVQSQLGGWMRWRAVAMALAALLLVHVAASWLELHGLRGESARLNQSIAQVYGRVFPGQRPGTQPRRQFEQRLAQLSGGGAQQGELLPLLAALAAAEQNVPIAKLESLSFKTGTMQLRLNTPDAEALELFSQALRAAGYGVETLSGSPQGDHYAGQLEVKARKS
jgi:general secretion pathway protein L